LNTRRNQYQVASVPRRNPATNPNQVASAREVGREVAHLPTSASALNKLSSSSSSSSSSSPCYCTRE